MNGVVSRVVTVRYYHKGLRLIFRRNLFVDCSSEAGLALALTLSRVAEPGCFVLNYLRRRFVDLHQHMYNCQPYDAIIYFSTIPLR